MKINFEIAYERTLRWEGGYVNDPDDPGGETIFGISRRNNPKWIGWATVDSFKKKLNPAAWREVFNKNSMLEQLAYDYYKHNYWRKKFENIKSQSLVNSIFDFGVNAGLKTSIKTFQATLPTYTGKIDGIIGPITLRSVYVSLKEEGEARLIQNFTWERICHYWHLAEKNPRLGKFLKGWVRRASYFLIT